MHEFSIGESLVRAIGEELDQRDNAGRLVRARVVVGLMRQIVPENLQMAFEVLTRDTAMAGAELELVSKPVIVDCRQCEWKGAIKPPVFMCGECGSGDVDVVSGMELYLDQLEVEDNEHDEHQGV